MHRVTFVVLAALSLPLAGCQSGAQGVAATLVGSAAASTKEGTLIGGLAGTEVGGALSAGERKTALAAEYQALEFGRAGTSTPWSNRWSGHYGTVVPGAPYRVNDTTCREYTHTIVIDGKPQIGQGSACRMADGSWRTVS
jgi:surface antigen